MWTAGDLSQFTQAVSKEHEFEHEEKSAKLKMESLEDQVERLQNSYEDIVRERYQEELLVAERNRGISNILTWSLMLANLGMFCISQLIVEPYRQSNIKKAVRLEVKKVVETIEADYGSLLASIATLSDKIDKNTGKVNETTTKLDTATAQLTSLEHQYRLAMKDQEEPKPVLEKKPQAVTEEDSAASEQVVSSSDSFNLHAITLAAFFAISIVATLIKAS
jgi:peptidoglycan hydrolase CwlO-like protein